MLFRSKDIYQTCHTSEQIRADCKTSLEKSSSQCGELEVFCYDSCLVRDHPQCVEGPCVLYEEKLLGETDPAKWATVDPSSSFDESFCSVPCHGVACSSDAKCEPIRSLKFACTKDSECDASAPWARCEPVLYCETSKVECETDADCGDQRCLVDDDAQKYCTYKFCIPTKYVAKQAPAD